MSICIACGTAVVPTPQLPRHEELGGELLAHLPTGAQRCGLTRPGLVSGSQKNLLLPLARGHAIGWMPGAPIVMAATAEKEDSFGRRSTIVIARLSESADRAHAWLSLAVPVRLDLRELEPNGQTTTRSDPHAFRVRRLDDRTLRFDRGRWRATDRPGAEVDCLALARRFPTALEVSSARPAPGLLLPDLPHRVDHVIHRRRSGVTVERTAYGRAPVFTHDLRLGSAAAIATEYERRFRRESAHVLLRHYRWDDLELAQEDSVRITRARRAELALTQPLPPDEVDVSNLARVREQLRLWAERLSTLRVEGRASAAESLATLLEKARQAHPNRVFLVRRQVRLLLDELNRPAEALRVLDQATVQNASQPHGELALLRREALARSGDRSGLADALFRDLSGILGAELDANAIEAAATQLIRLALSGRDYATSEGAWIASARFGPYLDTVTLRRVTPTRIDRGGLLEALSALISLRLRDERPAMLSILLRSSSDVGEGPNATVPELEFALGPHTVRVIQVTTGPRAFARSSIGGFASSDAGSLTVGLFVVPVGDHAGEPSAALIVRGVLSPHGFTIRAADPVSASLQWRRIQRLLATPLGQLDGRLFPPPEARIDAGSSTDADAMMRIANGQAVRCQREEWRVSCRSRPSEPDAARRFLWSLASFAARQDSHSEAGD